MLVLISLQLDPVELHNDKKKLVKSVALKYLNHKKIMLLPYLSYNINNISLANPALDPLPFHLHNGSH